MKIYKVRLIVEDEIEIEDGAIWDGKPYDIESAKEEAEEMARDIRREFFCSAVVESVEII